MSPLIAGGDECLDESALFGNLAVATIFADRDLLTKFLEQIGLEIANILATSARITALAEAETGCASAGAYNQPLRRRGF